VPVEAGPNPEPVQCSMVQGFCPGGGSGVSFKKTEKQRTEKKLKSMIIKLNQIASGLCHLTSVI
jgi:uncharacterized membrane protein